MEQGQSKAKCWMKLIGSVVLIGGIGYGAFAWHFSRTVKNAEAAMAKGFPAVAAESLEWHRTCMTSNEKNCRTLLSVYFGARMPQRLEWASQACLNAGIEIPESYIGLSAARDLSGRPQEAAQILASVAEKFKDIPDIYYRLAQLLARLENSDAALGSYSQAIQRAQNNPQIALEAIEYASKLKAWSRAKPMAESIKAVQTDNPAVKLLLARVFKNAGDSVSAKAMVAEAQPMMEKSPNKDQIAKAFSDVLGGGSAKN
jgi:tetratricopeptide (TPR) repeat protein